MLAVDHLTKIYKSGSYNLTVLDDVSFEVKSGEACSLVGPSGSGKTTLLGLCAGLDRPSRGEVTLANVALSKLNEDQLSDLRNQIVGFVFQSFQLIPTLTAQENVMVPLELRGERLAQTRREQVSPSAVKNARKVLAAESEGLDVKQKTAVPVSCLCRPCSCASSPIISIVSRSTTA